MGAALQAFTRRKDLSTEENLQNKLNRSLRAPDLIFIGVGSTLGAGVYVITADVVKNNSGPGAFFSFLFAGLASYLSALCYAEFGARIPKAGTAYVYTYATAGELPAFLVGWNLLLEYLIGSAAIARAWTANIDSLANNAISRNLMENVATWHTPGISAYPDFFSFLMCLFVGAIILAGPRISAWINTLMSAINLLAIFILIVLGMMMIDVKNWSPFFPQGVRGVLKGSIVAYYAFVGYDVMALCIEETKNPGMVYPASLFTSIGITFASYGALILTLTLVVSSADLQEDAAIANAFGQKGMKWAKYIIAVGATAGLTSSFICCMFAIPRLLFAIADDGLLFSPFSSVNKVTKTPVFGTMFAGLVTGWLAMYFELSTLVEMMTIGTLQAYTAVAACLLLIRYQVEPIGMVYTDRGFEPIQNDSLVNDKEPVRLNPTKRTSMLATTATIVIIISCFLMGGLFTNYADYLLHGYFWAIVIFFTLLGALTVAFTVIVLQPQNKYTLPFEAPFVPLLPLASMFINVTMMMELAAITWARFGLWIVLGLIVYLFYGVQHSKRGQITSPGA